MYLEKTNLFIPIPAILLYMNSTDTEGTLYVVATPIGNLADISFRAVEVLREADCVLCEDTRTSSVLLAHYQISTPKLSLYAHNEAKRCNSLIKRLKQGQRLAMISDAGTPLFSDAGHLLVAACHREQIPVVPIPGANAVAAALSCSGFEGNRFVFEGFLPSRRVARIKHLQYLKGEKRMIVFFEAPHRIIATINDMIEVFGGERAACLAKELSKIHEHIIRGSLSDIGSWLSESEMHSKGEFVILMAACKMIPVAEVTIKVEDLVRILSEHLSPGKVATVAATLNGMPRNRLYRKKELFRNTK